MVLNWLFVSALSSFIVITLGAFGAHSLKDILDAYSKEVYEKAVQYHMYHSLAIALVGLLQTQITSVSFAASGWAFLIGTILFSGSLYLLAITGYKWLGAITPLGGASFLFGWALLAYRVLKVS